ncbi:GFA family protein [Aliikangiella coralliicola]|uniref:GFA family protein n=1 Tax=Aliikangiella coralliicola TaxID=2592383 RepID=A0A545UFK2_9GAMM|nr:GFA family protein [Aliikangiella coralliicola]TQV88251.1 GFA family protein [Aliikangiella coralliicola]
MTNAYKGGCLCGNIRFTVVGEPKNPHACSCKICQRHSGSITQLWVEFSKQQVSWDGPGGEPAQWRSSDFSSRSFCPVCGSTLGAIDDEPVVALVLGVFDSNNKKELKPNSHSYKSKTPKWWSVEINKQPDT